MAKFKKDLQFYKFCAYGFLKNLRFFDAFIILAFRKIGFSYLQIGFLFSVREISTNILEIPTGILADAYGRRKAMVFSFSSYIISLLIFYFSKYYYLFLLGMIFFASGEAFRSGTHKAMILQYLKIKNMEHIKVHYYGNTRGCSQFGSAVSSIIAGAIIFFTNNYSIIFLGTIFPYILELGLMLSYPAYLDGDVKKVDEKNIIKRIGIKIKYTLKDFVNLFKSKSFLKVVLNSSLFDGYFKSIKDYIQPIIKTMVIASPLFLSLSEEKRVAVLVGLTYFILYLLTSFSSRNSGKLVDRVKNLGKSLNLTFLSGIVLIFIIGLTYDFKLYYLTIIFFIIYYMLQSMRRPMTVSFVSDLIESKIMATGLSVESQIKTLSIAVLSPIIGLLLDNFSIGLSFMIFSVLALLSYFPLKIKSVN